MSTYKFLFFFPILLQYMNNVVLVLITLENKMHIFYSVT